MGNMARSEPDSSEEIDKSCIFCLIANDQDEEAEVMKREVVKPLKPERGSLLNESNASPPQNTNKELVCFKDIDPAAPHHYLVVPRKHIHSCLSLHGRHISLVERMAEMGKAVLRDQGITDMTDIRLGFHKPPFISVDHLHLHVLAPTSQISNYMMYKFIPETDRFISEAHLRQHLKADAPPLKCNRLTNFSEFFFDEQ